MKNRIIFTTAIGLLFTQAAWAQSNLSELGIGTDTPEGTVHIVNPNSSVDNDSNPTNNVTQRPSILLKGAGSSEGDIAVLDNDTLQIGNWIGESQEYVGWMAIDTANVTASDNNGNASDTTRTRIRIYGDNAQSEISYYSGLDNNLEAQPYEHREELSIKSHTRVTDSEDENGEPILHDGSGLHLYGNNDSQHSGSVAFFNGGKSSFSINKFRQVSIGSHGLLNDYENNSKGRLNIINPQNEPGIYIEGASSSEGDITWKDGEHLQMGSWSADNDYVSHDEKNSGAFNEVMKLTSNGVQTINNPHGDSSNPGYVQLDTVDTATPPVGDCSSQGHVGRMTVHATKSRLFICTASGWNSIFIGQVF